MGKTKISFQGTRALINGEPTYKGCSEVEGLLFNLRTVHATFDDTLGIENYWDDDGTRAENGHAGYGAWKSSQSADANTARFIDKLAEYKSYGILAINLNFQGGQSLKSKTWLKESLGSAGKGANGQRDFLHNSGFFADGTIDPAYERRISSVIEACDNLGMAVILQLFYYGQDAIFPGETEIRNAVDQAVDYVCTRGYTNILLEIANEVSQGHYHHDILKLDGVAELIEQARNRAKHLHNRELLVSTSDAGVWTTDNIDTIFGACDYILLHDGDGRGNVGQASVVEKKIEAVMSRPWYQERPRPIIFNETNSEAGFDCAVRLGASFGLHNSEFVQTVWPAQWGVWDNEIKWFFDKARRLTTINER